MKQGSNEWLEFRRSKIGASDAPVIMGISPWKSKTELLREKRGSLKDSRQTDAMRRGIDLEPKALAWFEAETGMIMIPDIVQSQIYPWMIASMDGISMDGSEAVEIKCPNPLGDDHISALAGVIPEKYAPQLQHQMAVCDLPALHYCSFDGESGVILRVEADSDYQKRLIEKEIEFFHEMQAAPDESIEWAEAARDWMNIKSEMDRLAEILEEKKKRLISLSSGTSYRGAGIEVTRSTRRGAVDYSRIPELAGLDLEMYRKPDIEIVHIKAL